MPFTSIGALPLDVTAPERVPLAAEVIFAVKYLPPSMSVDETVKPFARSSSSSGPVSLPFRPVCCVRRGYDGEQNKGATEELIARVSGNLNLLNSREKCSK